MTVALPFLADGVEGGDVVTVLVKAGDTVREGQPLLELETDKATVPVPAPAAGKVERVLVHDGDHVTVGQGIAELEASDVRRQTADAGAPPPATRAPRPATAAAALPPSPQPPPREEHEHTREVRRHDREETEHRAAATPAPPEAQAIVEPLPPPASDDRRPTSAAVAAAAPSVRRLARELGVDLAQVTGSESGGRISADDVKGHVRGRGIAPRPDARQPAAGTKPAERREALPSLRRKIAANVAQAWSTIPHVHQFIDADITVLTELQKRQAPKFKERGASLTLTALVMKAVAGVLPRFPAFHASLDLTGGEVVYKDAIHLGVAVDTPAGLIVPVVRDADRKDLLHIARELADLAGRTRQRQVTLDELRGATFTISNLGGVGGGAFTPIINPPEVAILGVGRGRIAPVWMERGFEPRTVLPLCVAYDHRLIDGADGARFAEAIKHALENYEDALLGL